MNVVGVRTADGFVVKKEVQFQTRRQRVVRSIRLKKRQQYKSQIDENFVLQEDMLFNTPSGAVSFVCGASTNGKIWIMCAKII
ncbi:DUF4357 domain-containing protein [Mediterraneibacter gnavus]|uniref:DUF4357 domain-containing protein n=1 Tax=Mediterraneibacter gnavus TaxID=33038 RepID=UPI0013FDC56B